MPNATDLPMGLLGAIDIGSNSFRLEIGQLRDGKYRRQLYVKETVRLGAGLDANGMLTEEAAARGLACLQRFSDTMAEERPAHVRAVATQTLREARNRNEFLARAQQVLGLPIEVISGREEARLIYAGVAHMQPSSRPRLVVDIGGRSTEMILGRGRTPLAAESFRVGSVSLSLRYFEDGKLTAAGFQAAQVAAGAELEEALERFSPSHWREALGSSGTVGAVSEILRACSITDGRITPVGLRWMIERCLEAGHIDQLQLAGIKPDRREVLAGGLALLYTIAVHFRINELLPAKGALRQGVIVDLHERLAVQQQHRGHDLRDKSVRALQKRFGIDTAQADRVCALTRALYAQVMPQASGIAQLELRWAAELHEIGWMVSHHDHHRHSAYLLANIDAAGFSQSQQRRLSDLVLGQRGGLRKLEALLADGGYAWQVLCLRLAVIACHAREDVDAADFTLLRDGSTATLHLPAGYAVEHPRTWHLLREEAATWAASSVLTLELVS